MPRCGLTVNIVRGVTLAAAKLVVSSSSQCLRSTHDEQEAEDARAYVSSSERRER